MKKYMTNRKEGSDKGSSARFCILVSIFFLLPVFFCLPSMARGEDERRVVNEEIGILVATITEVYKQDLNLENANGVIVLGVLPGGPADEGGIHPGDVILGIADLAVNDIEDYEEALNRIKGKMDFNIMIRNRDGMFSFIQIVSREQ